MLKNVHKLWLDLRSNELFSGQKSSGQYQGKKNLLYAGAKKSD